MCGHDAENLAVILILGIGIITGAILGGCWGAAGGFVVGWIILAVLFS